MATITKTFTENGGSYNKGTWTISVTGTNKTVNGDFTLAPTVTAKVSVSSKGYGSANINLRVSEDTGAYILFRRPASYDDPYPAFSSGTTYSLTNKEEKAVQLSRVFNASNKTSRTANLTLQSTFINLDTYSSSSGASWTWYDNTNTVTWGTIATVTLDAPPTVETVTGTYSTPHYVGLGTYTVSLSNINAQYGGDLSKITLTVGIDSTTITYAENTTSKSSETISVIPTIAGNWAPILTIEDSRGQTYTETLPQIVVNSYNIPSTSFDVYRTNDIGIKNDEGHYALIQSTISYTDAIATLTEPSIQIDGADLSSLTDASVTWYTTWNNANGVSNIISDWTTLVPQNHMVTIYGLIDWDYNTTGNFAEDTSYQITLIANDSLNGHSTSITQTLSTAFYTIDFKAGGKEIAFGAPANDVLTINQQSIGLFKCGMESHFNNISQFNSRVIVTNLIGEIKMYSGLVIPTGWLLCDGSEVLIEDYPLLNNALGGDSENNIPATLWGIASDSDYFVLPNFVGRIPLGASEINTTTWISITGENEYSSFTIDSPTYARWGTGDTWLYAWLQPGVYMPTYQNMNEYFGGDPASGVAKYIQVALNVGSNGGYSWWRPSITDMPSHNHNSRSLTGSSKAVFSSGQSAGGSGIVSHSVSSNRQYTTNGTSTNSWGVISVNATHTHDTQGGGRYISQMPPFAVVNYIICAV